MNAYIVILIILASLVGAVIGLILLASTLRHERKLASARINNIENHYLDELAKYRAEIDFLEDSIEQEWVKDRVADSLDELVSTNKELLESLNQIMEQNRNILWKTLVEKENKE